MSQARAKKFIKALEADANLRNKVNQASEQIVKVAKDNGYDVTREEIGAALGLIGSEQRRGGAYRSSQAAFFRKRPVFELCGRLVCRGSLSWPGNRFCGLSLQDLAV